MGSSNSKKPEITIKSIRMSTEDIRSSLRRKKPPLSKEDLHQTLISNSKQLENLRSKQSKKKKLEINQLQKLVSDVSEELLEYNDEHLDKSADESHSFIHVEPDQLKKQKKSLKSIKTPTPKFKSSNQLNDIERELSRVKNDVSVGIKNEDNKFILLQKKKIEMLSTDLELLNIPETSLTYEKKQQLEKDLYRYYQKIIRREKNQARLSRLNSNGKMDREERNKINYSRLHALEIMIQDIYDILQNTLKGDNRGDTIALREELDKIGAQLNQIEDENKENLKSKTVLLRKVDNLRKTMNESEKKKEMNDLLKLFGEIDRKKAELPTGNKFDDTKSFSELKEYVGRLQSFTTKYSENEFFKVEHLQELDKFLERIDPNHNGVVMREKKLKGSKSVDDLMHLQEEWKNLEKNIRSTKVDELQKVNNILEKFEESIRAKRKSLADLLNKSKNKADRRKSCEVIRTSAKISELPTLQTTQSKNNIQQETKRKSITSSKYGSVEYALEEITKTSDRVEEIGKELLTFSGTSEDLEYNFFKASLMDKKKILMNVYHRSSWNQVDALKLEVLEKIAYYEDYLQYKLNQNSLEMKLNEELNDLDIRIKRFAGSYQDIQYRNIEEKLLSCLKEIESVDMSEKSEKLKQRTNYLNKKLKEKSQMDIPLKQEENLTDTKKVIAESKEFIQNLRRKIEQSSVLEEAECSLIEECIMSKTLEIINLNLKNDTATFQDVRKLLENIEDCKSLIKSKRRKEEDRTRSETFSEIEMKLVDIYKEISEFDGLVTDTIFMEIHKSLSDLEVKLCGILENENTQGKSLELSLRINLLKAKLDQVALESEQIHNLENRVKEILDMVSNGLPETEYDNVDEELINLRIRLEKLDVSEKLSYKKLACLNYIEYLLKKVNEKPDHRGANISRSVIV